MRRYATPAAEYLDAKRYTYDMGDDWRHTVVVEAVELDEHEIKYPCFVTGERRCPPEDIGGLPGFERFL
ncbi:IS1096 element passenger TnpR family protein [Sphingomonas sp. PP-CE-3A-406]|uniref:IS1096 element passenger TnpR family protein n=1 Tax=Sphingomonas sp. PP-CE-3A-406 TaxID=2135659 RepID=UPI000EFA1955|nr:hypothetical protein [Sphingomonas sp. PP-CE-3A-406]